MKNLHKKKDGTYQARIRFDVSEKIIYRSLKTKNIRVARKALDKLYHRLELERAGLIKKPVVRYDLKKLFLRYLSDLSVTCSSVDYVNRCRTRLSAVAAFNGWSWLDDVTSSGFIEWRSTQPELMPKTLNDYLSAWRSFFSWLTDRDLVDENPFENVKRIPIRGRVSFRRRALTDSEVSRLLELPERRSLYLLALFTGLRRGELSKLIASDFNLQAEPPFLLLRGNITKNGKDAMIYLHADLKNELGFLRHLKKNDLAFEVPRSRVIRRDYARAEIVDDESGRRTDFHSLRYTFCTRLAQSGVSPQVAKELMRHSDIRLTTDIYTDTGLLGADGALKLPSLISPPHISPQKEPDLTPYITPRDGNTLAEVVLFKLMEMLDLQPLTTLKNLKKMVEVGGIEPPSD